MLLIIGTSVKVAVINLLEGIPQRPEEHKLDLNKTCYFVVL